MGFTMYDTRRIDVYSFNESQLTLLLSCRLLTPTVGAADFSYQQHGIQTSLASQIWILSYTFVPINRVSRIVNPTVRFVCNKPKYAITKRCLPLSAASGARRTSTSVKYNITLIGTCWWKIKKVDVLNLRSIIII